MCTHLQFHLLIMFTIGVYLSVSRAHYTIILQYWLFVDVANILAVMSALALCACAVAFYFMHAQMRYYLHVVGAAGDAHACSPLSLHACKSCCRSVWQSVFCSAMFVCDR